MTNAVCSAGSIVVAAGACEAAGFTAEAETAALTVDGEEIADARWFTAAELAAFGDWGDDGAEFRLPRRDSIARGLVDGWVASVTGGR